MRYSLRLICAMVVLSCTSISFAQENTYDVCRNGNLEQIQSIYNKDNETINTPNDRGYLPLTLACYHSNLEVVNFLVDKVKDINANNNQGTALMAAVYKQDVKIVELLLNNNANPNLSDSNGATAMHYAVMFQNYDIIKLLIKAKGDFDLKDNSGKSAKDFAINYNDNQLNSLLNLN